MQAKVTVIVKYNSIIDCPRLVKVWDKIDIVEADLRNTDSVSEMKKLTFDLVFHLAAYNHVGDSFKHVIENINSNIISTVNLLNNGPNIKKLSTWGLQKFTVYNLNFLSTYLKSQILCHHTFFTKFGSELFAILKSKKQQT